jgi:MIP family channel proteins
VLVYATGNISGGHINPAVTFALTARQVISVSRGLMYIISQMGGAVCGSFFLRAILPNSRIGSLGVTSVSPHMNLGEAFGLEMFTTFFLVIVVFLCAVDEQGAGELAPLAIGLTVFIDHLIAVPWTGASMNPARSFGPAVAMGHFEHHWIYWVGPGVGALVAAGLYTAAFEFRKLAPKDEEEGKPQYDRVANNPDLPEQANRARTRTRIGTRADKYKDAAGAG